MPETDALVQTLQNLPAVGKLIKDRGYRQIWRFEFHARAYYLKWYPRGGFSLKRLVMGNPAMAEFARLVALQNGKVPSPRAVAVLKGFKIDGRQGDALIISAIEPSIQLDRYLAERDIAGGDIPNRHRLAQRLVELVYQLGRARLRHVDLHLGNLLLDGTGQVHLLDGYAVRNGGLRGRDLMMFGHSVAPWATRTDIVRGWRLLTASEGLPPVDNSVSPRLYRKFLQRTRGENHYFGRLRLGGWRGYFVKGLKLPRWWAQASDLSVTRKDWEREWPALLGRMEADSYSIIKRGDSGDVVAGTALLGGREVEIVIKRPRHKTTMKRIGSVGRPARARRSWFKAWKLMIRGFATEWPLLLMERKVLGYTADSVLVMARVPGETLMDFQLDSLTPGRREDLFRRLGRTLRRLEQAGFGHFDAKSSNWIVYEDPVRGPWPVMVDVDGVRHYRWDGTGIKRLLRAMKQHAQYTPQDSRWLCQGYAPFARIEVDEPQLHTDEHR